MLQYFAAIWNPTIDAQRCAAARLSATICSKNKPWLKVLSLPGLLVFLLRDHSPDTDANPGFVEFESGIIVGTLFDQISPESRATHKRNFESHEIARIHETRGREIISAYWGNYVAFINSAARGTTSVIRDPSGALDCLMASFDGIRVFFSSLAECPVRTQLDRTVNWDHVIASITIPLAETRETGLKGVTRLLKGECLEVDWLDRASSQFFWDPFRIIRSETMSERVKAESAVRYMVKAVVHRLVSPHRNVLHLLSGGLDSTIVLGCLVDAPTEPSVTCINCFYSRGASSDERLFAREVARYHRRPLIEFESDPDLDREAIMRPPIVADPYDFITLLASRKPIARAAKTSAATAIFSGIGGDEIFLEAGTLFTVADHIHATGISKGALRAAMVLARLSGETFWQTLAKGIADALLRDPMAANNAFSKPLDLVDRQLATDLFRTERFQHPWLKSRDAVAPGKRWQVVSLCYPHVSAPDDAEAPEDVNPLLSQPLVELCLRIPTTVLSDEGCSRILARRAFTSDAPRAALWRERKCIVQDLPRHIVSKHQALFREIILDGQLVTNGFVIRSEAESLLKNSLKSGFGRGGELCLLASVELWLRQWSAPAVTRSVA